jgi:hypothetical protein
MSEITGGEGYSNILFRDKTMGWKDFSISYDYGVAKHYRKSHLKDPYFTLFLRNIILRPSCYACNFKGANRKSDLTLGDFWGMEQILGTNDNKGVTLILANTFKGKAILDRLNIQKRKLNEEDAEAALNYNSVYSSSVIKRPSYETEMNCLLNTKKFSNTYRFLTFKLFRERVANKLRSKSK